MSKYYKSDEGYFFLKKINIKSDKDLYKQDCINFSFFKFGVKKIFNFYVKQLVGIIKKEVSINSGEWVIVSRANFIHNYISGSISDALTKEIAKKLNLKHVISYPTIDLKNDINYSKLNSFQARSKEINKRKYLLHFPENVNLKNKNIIFIDDIINTGITIKTIHESLKKYNIKRFEVFTIAKLFTSNPEFEYKLSRVILDKKFKNKNLKLLKKLFSNSELIITHKFLKILKIELKW
jgi:hypoxanthine phosphoribosyltransferase